ncbi:trimethyllysine dioxygenase, mitochondrial-like [Gigantopelta aegis]|uniref:trimethyllysine dioxygenase, mitochondrial-like n=1 Tax=Gigantopelta aegis TaxID=1735272 RepID=UPI001B8886A7|nr:trimethyllysine dioxygenase, mitochondrial-like [Gigantopelta aegis]XP_041353191.1 trimethyllysine dioxygenase, mitochondrial-like [Gigantopelta aegis]
MLSRIVFPLRQQIRNARHCQNITEIQVLTSRTACSSCAATYGNRDRSRPTDYNNSAILPENKFVTVKSSFPRCLSSEAAITAIEKRDRYLELHHEGQVFTIPYMWLRDHCRCSHCFNEETGQKNVSHKISGIGASGVELEEFGTTLKILWEDGHKTEYSVQWLVDNSYSTESKKKTIPLLWDSAKIHSEPMPVVDYESYKTSETGIRETMYNLLRYGFSVVEGVPTSPQDTEEVVLNLNFVEETLFGKMFYIMPNNERPDTAYTNTELGAHNDTCYFTAPIGVMALHCLMHDGTGGETLLVDGFQVAEKLRQEDPAAFTNLTNQIVPHEYVEEGFHIHSHGRVLTIHPASKEMENIRFNPYDMAPLDTIPPNEVEQFYKDYKKLTKLIYDPANSFWFKLHPGMLVFINNWRVLHGRASFTGKRVLSGAYIPYHDWMSKARVAGLV